MKKMTKNTIVTIYHIVGETAFAVLEGLGDSKFRFTTDAYIDDSDRLHHNVFKHLRQAIPARKGKVVQEIKVWPRLRWALRSAGLQPVNIPGGNYPLHYADEIAVPDFCMSGSHFFIIPRKKIGKYLDQYPLNDRGIARKRKEEQTKLDAWLQSRDPDYIAGNIGDKFWYQFDSLSQSVGGGCEFVKITVTDCNYCNRSIIYARERTDLIWDRWINVPKIVCEAPETGVEFLGPGAAAIDPREHCRIKKRYCSGWSSDVAYLQPKSGIADYIGEGPRWTGVFDNDNGGIFTSRSIADAKKITLEVYDLTDKLLPNKLVYTKESNKVVIATA